MYENTATAILGHLFHEALLLRSQALTPAQMFALAAEVRNEAMRAGRQLQKAAVLLAAQQSGDDRHE